MKKIIITVPHSYCQNIDTRNCDTRAYQVGLLLSEKLKGYLDVIFLPNEDLPRKTVDMNRSESRNTSYRINLSNILKQVPSDTWVLDIHSFPLGGFGEIAHNIYILDNIPDIYSPYHIPNSELREFTSNLPSAISSIKILEGSEKNDIQREARIRKLKSLIFEFCENEDYYPYEKLNSDINIIAETFVNIYTKYII